MKLLNLINEAFNTRNKPNILTSSKELSEEEFQEVIFFQDKSWSMVTCEQFESHHESIYWFTPDAFQYYLLSMIYAGVKEQKTDLLVYDSIINMLDRSPKPEYWDNFFIERWTLFTYKEYEIIQEWLLWLTSFDNLIYDDDSLSRSFETLELLKNRGFF